MNKVSQKKTKRKLNEVENNNSNRCTNVEDVTELLKKSRNILVITGAGISVSCGIPDFRSKENGLYNTLDCASIGIPSAELLFDFQFFLIDPEPFYYFAKSLLPCDNIKPSICHQFIALLEKKKKLLRNYTQNVDCLEKKVGITKVIECHGSLSVFKCIDCKSKKKINDEIITTIKNGEVPYCKKCRDNGVLKPEITFFGEKVPDKFTKTMSSDISKGKCDLIIVIGTSLKVGGSVHDLLNKINDNVPRILINKDIVHLPSNILKGFDFSFLGDCDEIINFLAEELDWTEILLSESKSNGLLNQSNSLLGWNCEKIEDCIFQISKK